MKRYIRIVALIFVLVLTVSACGIQTKTSQNDADTRVSNAENTRQSLSKEVILTSDSNINNWMRVDLSEVGLSNLTIGCVENGYITKDNRMEQKKMPIYILCDYAISTDMYHIPYLMVVLSDKVLIKDLTDKDANNGSYSNTLYIADVDGDGIDEIIVQQTVGMSGGGGSYLSRVFKVEEEKIREIFTSVLQESSDADWTVWNTGFTSEFLNDYKLGISNEAVNYRTTIDISNRYAAEFFDQDGKGKSRMGILCDSFREFAPKDVDNDGIYELVCLQYVSLADHSDYIGDAKTILKYNAKSQTFEVAQAEFIPNQS